ncbi:geranylgeranyl reductase family protein [Natronomonas sp. F2-12]|uniref:Geranylgeranyl reductase family protein n=1 Tax=Natronomonas aquatica TaxID=2841590 RepID=A0A9R1CNV7_9EURY|nr:geranylgeranyl reductase family protein [Natronomonas aquatica]MCQ4332168.1 geranylgeranyl reductase family protein [Natronomonas aquatica]
MYDVLVVGAGPSGSRFARSAAEVGRDVLVLESGEIGQPLACSGHVSLDIWDFVPRSARERLRQNEVSGARFHLGGADSRAYRFYKTGVVSNTIDRVELDRTLAECAREAGARIRTGHTVTGVEERPDRVEVTAAGPDGVERFEARLVCGADGPRSKVRSQLGLPEPAELLHGVLGFDPRADHEDFVDVHLTVPRFFAWRIPRGEAGVEYGLAVPPGENAAGRFDELVDDYDADIERRCSGAIPIGPPDRTVGTRSFLVGDAAGQTKPFTGGGILYGMRAADVAAETIDPDNPATVQEYEHAWRSELGRDQAIGKAIRAGYSLPEPIQRVGLRTLSGEIGVHMDRPTSLFSLEQLRAMLSWR